MTEKIRNKFVKVSIDVINTKEELKESIASLIGNSIANKFIFFDEQMSNQIDPSTDKIFQTIKSGLPALLFAKAKDYAFKIKIESNQEGDFVTLYPIEPYKIKKGFGSEKEELDLEFYIKRMIELTENFAIYELSAE